MASFDQIAAVKEGEHQGDFKDFFSPRSIGGELGYSAMSLDKLFRTTSHLSHLRPLIAVGPFEVWVGPLPHKTPGVKCQHTGTCHCGSGRCICVNTACLSALTC